AAAGTAGEAIAVCHAGGRINQVAFSPTRRYLATANGNGTVYILRVDGRGSWQKPPCAPFRFLGQGPGHVARPEGLGREGLRDEAGVGRPAGQVPRLSAGDDGTEPGERTREARGRAAPALAGSPRWSTASGLAVRGDPGWRTECARDRGPPGGQFRE